LELNLAQVETHVGATVWVLDRDLSGETLGEYVLQARIGSGGMGAVYRARHQPTGSTFAVKVLASRLSEQKDLVSRFAREAQVLQTLTHPNIVACFEQGTVATVHYLVMEFIEGETLDVYCAREQLSVSQVIDVVRQIAQTLAAAHAQGVVHRDLKPANIMIQEGGQVKVLDFGIAQLLNVTTALTQTRAILGTANYMSPEQRLASAHVDARSDVFSLGVILYQMLTGTLPAGHFESPRQLNSKVSAGLDAAVMKMLQRDPNKRFESMNNVDQALASILHKTWPSSTKFGLTAAVILLLGITAGYLGNQGDVRTPLKKAKVIRPSTLRRTQVPPAPTAPTQAANLAQAPDAVQARKTGTLTPSPTETPTHTAVEATAQTADERPSKTLKTKRVKKPRSAKEKSKPSSKKPSKKSELSMTKDAIAAPKSEVLSKSKL